MVGNWYVPRYAGDRVSLADVRYALTSPSRFQYLISNTHRSGAVPLRTPCIMHQTQGSPQSQSVQSKCLPPQCIQYDHLASASALMCFRSDVRPPVAPPAPNASVLSRCVGVPSARSFPGFKISRFRSEITEVMSGIDQIAPPAFSTAVLTLTTKVLDANTYMAFPPVHLERETPMAVFTRARHTRRARIRISCGCLAATT